MLNIFTLVFNGEPFIERHLAVFQKLKCNWRWVIVHGPANNGGSTRWCQSQGAGTSTDGTWEYLNRIGDLRVLKITQDLWPSKDDMANAALKAFKEPGVLLQVDSDEIWTIEQLEEIVRLFDDFPKVGSMRFNCRYCVGPDLLAVGEDSWGGNDNTWLRAWRFYPGMYFDAHEAMSGPKLHGTGGYCMTRAETARCGLIFDHFAYATEAQVAYKERFYGYAGATDEWRRLQAHEHFPVQLKKFWPWIKDGRTMVIRKEGEENVRRRNVSEVRANDGSTTDDSGATGRAEETSGIAVGRRERCAERDGRQSSSGASDRVGSEGGAPVVSPNGGEGVQSFAHSGDSGDILASLPAVRDLGGGEYVVTGGSNGQRASMEGERFDALRPLLEAQPYIEAVRWESDTGGAYSHDFREFRRTRNRHDNLALQQAWTVGIEVELTAPWLTVPDHQGHGRVVIARSQRYHNYFFPWRDLLRLYPDAVFVGLEAEHWFFENKWAKQKVEYRKHKDLLSLARFIAGASLFIGNQSCPFWIAAGLGVPLIQESWESDLNSVVRRDNALYTMTPEATRTLMIRLKKRRSLVPAI